MYRRWEHQHLTFSMLYAFNENFILPFSHDEVVHGKGSMMDKVPGDAWQKAATLRVLYAFMCAHPGQEADVHGQRVRPVARMAPRRVARLAPAERAAARRPAAVRRRSEHVYRERAGAATKWTSRRAGFEWIDCNDHESSVISFIRRADDPDDWVVVVAELDAGRAPRLPRRRARGRLLQRAAEQRRRLVRRQQRRQSGRADHPNPCRRTGARIPSS